VGLVLLLAVHLGVAAWWLARDREPLLWDMAEHAGKVVKVQHVLYRSEPPMRAERLPEALREIAAAHPLSTRLALLPVAGPANWIEAHYRGSARPPLSYLPSAVALGPSDATPDAIALAHGTGWFLVLIVATYLLGLELYGARGALLSAVIVSGYPLFLGQARVPMLDTALAAWAALGIRWLARSNGFRDRRSSLLVGAALGAGMLVKQPFFVVLVLPICSMLLDLARARREGCPSSDARSQNVVAAGLAALLVAGPWYLVNIVPSLGFIAMSAASGAGEGDPTSLSLAGLLYYPRSLVEISMGPAFSVLGIAGLAALFVRREGGATREGRGPALLGLGVLGVAICFVLIHPNKDARYFAPALPLLAVASAGLLARVRTAPLQGIVGCAVVALAVVQVAAVTSGGAGSREDSAWRRLLSAFRSGSVAAHSPNQAEWRLDDVLETIARHRSGETGEVVLFVEESGKRYVHGLAVRVARDRLRARDGLPVQSLSVVSAPPGSVDDAPGYLLQVTDSSARAPSRVHEDAVLLEIDDLPGGQHAALVFRPVEEATP
jgi:hypothetical protein